MAMEILIPVLILSAMGLVFGAGLALASKIFEVKMDERVPLVREALPGANCGGCGYPGCDALASSIVKGEALINACPVGGLAVASKIGEIMGKSAGASEPEVACVQCKGDCENAPNRSDYYGIHDCREALIANGGIKKCRYGCIGFGTCVEACMFGALSMGDNGLPEVDVDKCTSCGKCKAICPNHIIDLIPKNQLIHVDCHSMDKGKIVRSNCSVGCIACKACVKVCPEDAIIVENNLATINYEKCVQCGACVEKCPTGAITFEDRIIVKEETPEIELEPETDLNDEPNEAGKVNNKAIPESIEVEVMEEIVTLEGPEIKIAEIESEENLTKDIVPETSNNSTEEKKEEIKFKITDL
ncbi:MAG: RnfABCDGE type electron transport complex subunit B [Eubacterium sp.]